MIFLLVAPGFLAEVLSENTPILTALHPVPFVLLILTYGVPVVLIREIAVARRLNVVGIILLGVGYGMLNEGVLAKTLTLPGRTADRRVRGIRQARHGAVGVGDLHPVLARAAQCALSDPARRLALSRGSGAALVRHARAAASRCTS